MRRGLLAVLALTLAGAGTDVPERLTPPSYDEFLVIPLRVHILKAEMLPEVDCGLTDGDVRRVLGKMNAIWHQAGIHWGLESLVREPAAHQEEFKERRAALGDRAGSALGLFAMLAPEASRLEDGLNVYYIHRFAVNGVYLGDLTAFIQETARLRPVEGGIDEPLPRVTAHELGHALGLPHRQDRTNLLASGTNGTTLNTAEVDRARAFARKFAGTRDVLEVRRAAEAAEVAGDRPLARRLWSDLAAIPGGGAAEANRRRDALGAEDGRGDSRR